MLIWMHKVNYKTFGFNMWGKVWTDKKKPRSNLNFEKKLKQDQSSNCEIKWRSWYRFLALIWCSNGSGWDFSQLIDWNKPSFIFWRTHRDFKSEDIPHVPHDIVLTGGSQTTTLHCIQLVGFGNYNYLTQIIVEEIPSKTSLVTTASNKPCQSCVELGELSTWLPFILDLFLPWVYDGRLVDS